MRIYIFLMLASAVGLSSSVPDPNKFKSDFFWFEINDPPSKDGLLLYQFGASCMLRWMQRPPLNVDVGLIFTFRSSDKSDWDLFHFVHTDPDGIMSTIFFSMV